ncbi:MAG: ABC-F family ATP-binding cassette domain-containing protein [bacterium]
MLTLSGVTLAYGDRKILDDVTWHIGDRDRVGLVGPNGEGKSTLLKVACGKIGPLIGEIIKPKNQTVGYLHQDVMRVTGTQLWDHVLSGHKEILEAEAELLEMEEKLAQPVDDSEKMERILRRYGDLQEHFARIGGYDLETEASRILSGLGFPKERWHDRTEVWSGGWQVRIELARLLLRRPDTLLLDEPTNYLDLENIEWLEAFLTGYPGAIVLVCHDRVFLDRVTSRITEIERGNLIEYKGNYSFYESEKELRREQIEAAAKRQQKHIDHVESFINRYRADKRRAKLVQSRLKMLDKMETIEAPRQQRRLRVRFPQPPRSGKEVLKAEKLAKSYDSRPVFSDVELTILRGDRVALVGVNGAGKSTMMRLLNQRESPTDGVIKFGHNVLPAYMAQDHADNLVGRQTILEEMEDGAPRKPGRIFAVCWEPFYSAEMKSSSWFESCQGAREPVLAWPSSFAAPSISCFSTSRQII